MVQYLGITQGPMPYTTNVRLPDVRREARRLLKEGWSTRKVARHLGYSQSVVVKWSHRKTVDTLSSAPRTHPRTIPDELRARIIEKRLKTRRCAEVVYRLLRKEGVAVSLSSVKRTIWRYCAPLKARSPWKRTRKYPPRPEALHPGSLVQMDTIHFLNKHGVRQYVYTALDVYSRTGCARAASKIGGVPSVRFFDTVRRSFPFRIECVQTDNGPEFGKGFTDALTRRGVRHRHNHPRSPNENAHVERFNRTLQEEMPKEGWSMHVPRDIPAFVRWYNEERPHLSLDCLSPREFLSTRS